MKKFIILKLRMIDLIAEIKNVKFWKNEFETNYCISQEL